MLYLNHVMSVIMMSYSTVRGPQCLRLSSSILEIYLERCKVISWELFGQSYITKYKLLKKEITILFACFSVLFFPHNHHDRSFSFIEKERPVFSIMQSSGDAEAIFIVLKVNNVCEHI